MAAQFNNPMRLVHARMGNCFCSTSHMLHAAVAKNMSYRVMPQTPAAA
jgi:hypothetical protein